MVSKHPKDYSVKDIHGAFMKLYEQIHNEPYNYNDGKNKSPFPFIGNEIKALKKLHNEHDTYTILCAMYNAIGQNSTFFSVVNFSDSFERYKTKHDPKLYWYIIVTDDAKVKNAWTRYNILKATWFPNAGHNRDLKKLEDKFERWLEKIEKVD